MIWLNIKELENKISNDDLSDKDGFNYLLAFFILSTIGYSIASNDTNGWIIFLSCIISVLINVWGLKTIYEANKLVDGKDFFKRFFALYWVIGFRLFLLAIPAGIIAGIVMSIFSINMGLNYPGTEPIKDLVIMIFVSMFSVICYLMIINSIQRLKPRTE